MGNEERLTRALGILSLGLGVFDVVVPSPIADLIGVGDGPRSRAILRIVGAREIVCGVGLLTQRRRAGWLWARVAGDAMDLSLTTAALVADAPKRDRGRLLGTLAALLGITAADVYASIQVTRSAAEGAAWAGNHPIEVTHTITVLRSPEEVYHYWHDFTHLPRFMDHLQSVQVQGSGRSHWKAKAPAGTSVEWDAEVTEDQPNRVIAWRSLPGASVPNSGTVRFVPAPGGRGTEIHVRLRYDPPAGRLGALAARLFGEEPRQQLRDDLARLKQILETGQITLSDATAKGRGAAQPPENAPPAETIRRPEPALR